MRGCAGAGVYSSMIMMHALIHRGKSDETASTSVHLLAPAVGTLNREAED